MRNENQREESYLYIGTALSSIHVGGTGGNIIADMAIQKEPRELLPKIDSTAWKGSVYSSLSKDKNQKWDLLFSDLNLLFFPIRSNRQPFVLVTSPTQVQRFVTNLKRYNPFQMTSVVASIEQFYRSTNELSQGLVLGNKFFPKIWIGEYLYDVEEPSKLIKPMVRVLATLIQKPVEQIVIIDHEDFVDLVHDELEYITRVKIGEDHVSSEESLFVEEYLPEESVLYGFIKKQLHIGKRKQNETNVDMMKMPKIIQIGKNTTLGKGIMKLERGVVKNGN